MGSCYAPPVVDVDKDKDSSFSSFRSPPHTACVATQDPISISETPDVPSVSYIYNSARSVVPVKILDSVISLRSGEAFRGADRDLDVNVDCRP